LKEARRGGWGCASGQLRRSDQLEREKRPAAREPHTNALMYPGLSALLIWWLVAGSLFCVFLLFLWTALIGHRRCWRVPRSTANNAASEDAPDFVAPQPLPHSLRRDAAVLAARAFCDSPAYVYILRGDRNFRLEALVWLFERYISLAQDALKPSDPTRCILSTSGRVLSFFCLMPLASPISTWSKIRAGLLLFPLLFGLKPFMRLMALGDQFDQTTSSLVQKCVLSDVDRRDALVLERMVVEPSLHGRGLGSACLSSALSSRSEAPAPVVLSTQLQRNVEFYSRLGFDVVHEQRFGSAADPFSFRSWWMLRPAAHQRH
jgi:hypothetical protein